MSGSLAHSQLRSATLQVSDDDNNEEGDDENEEGGLELNQERRNKRKANRSHSARSLGKGNTRPCKMFKSETGAGVGGRKRRPQSKKSQLASTPPLAASFPSSLGPNLSIMTSGLDSSSLTSQTMAAANAASMPSSTVPGSQSPQLTQAAFAAATAALATAAAAAGMPVNQLITQVSQMIRQLA